MRQVQLYDKQKENPKTEAACVKALRPASLQHKRNGVVQDLVGEADLDQVMRVTLKALSRRRLSPVSSVPGIVPDT